MNLRQFWKIFILSFYSSSLYVEVANNWKHWGLRFLLQLSIFSSLIYTIIIFMLVFFFNPEKGEISELLKQVPEIDISNKDAVFVDENISSPQIIKFKGENIININLNVDYDKSDQKFLIFLDKNKIVMSFNGLIEELAYQEISKIVNQTTLDYKAWVSFINSIRSQILPKIIILGITCGSILFFLISACFSLFYASIAKIILGLTKSRLSLKSLFRLANISHAPARTLSLIAFSLFFLNQGFSLLQSLVNYIYMFYFIRAIMLSFDKKR